MNYYNYFILVAIMVFIGTSSIALASDDDFFIHEDYPGRMVNGSVLVVAMNDIQSGVRAYQKVFGRMPTSWADVVFSGLFDKKLLAIGMQEIDPDDGSIDFRGDIYLDTTTLKDNSGRLLMFSLWAPEGNSISRDFIELHDSYTQTFSGIISRGGVSESDAEIMESWSNDQAQLVQFGHIHMLSLALVDYREIYGQYPENLHQLVEAKLGPLTPDSINPVTGEKYKFDGSPGDISYIVNVEQNRLTIKHVDAKYNPTFSFSY